MRRGAVWIIPGNDDAPEAVASLLEPLSQAVVRGTEMHKQAVVKQRESARSGEKKVKEEAAPTAVVAIEAAPVDLQDVAGIAALQDRPESSVVSEKKRSAKKAALEAEDTVSESSERSEKEAVKRSEAPKRAPKVNSNS